MTQKSHLSTHTDRPILSNSTSWCASWSHALRTSHSSNGQNYSICMGQKMFNSFFFFFFFGGGGGGACIRSIVLDMYDKINAHKSRQSAIPEFG